MTKTLADSLAAGDPAAFATLYEKMSDRLFKTARMMMVSTADAEDVVHDLFVNLARTRHRICEIRDLEAYVFTMLRHACSRRRKRLHIEQKTLKKIEQDQASHGTPNQSPISLDRELEEAVASLPEEQRSVLALKFQADLTFEEIAEVMQTSANTAASRYRYALRKLRSLTTAQKEYQ
ncbi:MAG: sigma-70 family RNA polymerase sigma factor [Pirellulales bacterium]